MFISTKDYFHTFKNQDNYIYLTVIDHGFQCGFSRINLIPILQLGWNFLLRHEKLILSKVYLYSIETNKEIKSKNASYTK